MRFDWKIDQMESFSHASCNLTTSASFVGDSRALYYSKIAGCSKTISILTLDHLGSAQNDTEAASYSYLNSHKQANKPTSIKRTQIWYLPSNFLLHIHTPWSKTKKTSLAHLSIAKAHIY